MSDVRLALSTIFLRLLGAFFRLVRAAAAISRGESG
jgi:hypothetical protein